MCNSQTGDWMRHNLTDINKLQAMQCIFNILHNITTFVDVQQLMLNDLNGRHVWVN